MVFLTIFHELMKLQYFEIIKLCLKVSDLIHSIERT